RSASAAIRAPRSAAPSAIACSSLVTPDSAETTTSTRAPLSSARRFASRPMVSQRWRRDTEVPPNLSTIQRSEGELVGIEVVARPRVGHEQAILGLAVAGAHPATATGNAFLACRATAAAYTCRPLALLP